MCLVCGLMGCFESRPITMIVPEGQEADNVIDERSLPAGFVIELEQKGHAVDHYEESKHVYAQNIET